MFSGQNHRNPSVMKHKFSQVPKAEIPRSTFDRSHGHKTTFDAGYLIPIYADEALPGDTFRLNMAGFARLNTPIFPIMDNMFLETFFFAVPIRLIWDNWQKFNGEQANPGDSTDYTVPTMTQTATEGSLSDYLGIPPGVSLTFSSLWHRAYNLIWREWFRDQNLQNSPVVDTDDGPDTAGDYVLLRRGKRHDYFTSALPWPQKGDAVSIPLGTSAPVVGDGTQPYAYNTNGEEKALQSIAAGTSISTVGAWAGTYNLGWGKVAAGHTNTGLEADLSTATAATINSLRQAFQVQRLLERDARGGTRYTEIIKAHFGVTSPDARLQRPEYLGGGSTPINVHPIPQTSSTDATTPQGNLAAMGTAVAQNHGFTMSFTEHCVLLGLACVRADLTYQQGLERMFKRSTRYDFYWPALAHLGEQTVLQGEIYADGTANDDIVFGYQERYAEYRYKPSRISGAFRSSAATPLDSWHLSQEFGSAPTLDSTFIVENPPIDRVVAVTTEPDFLLDTYFSLNCARPMPVFGVPGFIDHF